MADNDMFIFEEAEELKEGEEKEIVLGGFNDSIDFEESEENPVVEEEKPEEKPEEVVEEDVSNKAIDQLNQSNADQLAAINSLNSQIIELRKQSSAKKEEVNDELDLPTEEDWENDPKAAIEKYTEAKESKFKSDLVKENDESFIRNKEYEVFETTHKQAWMEAGDMVPELKAEGTNEMKELVGTIYQRAGLKNHPMGPLLATCTAMVQLAKVNSAGDTTNARNEGAQIERSRQDRINQGTMSGDGGVDNGADGIVLDANHLKAAKELGLPIEVYKKSLKMVR